MNHLFEKLYADLCMSEWDPLFFKSVFESVNFSVYVCSRWFEGSQATKNIKGKDISEQITVSMAESDFCMCERTVHRYTIPSATVSVHMRMHIRIHSVGEGN